MSPTLAWTLGGGGLLGSHVLRAMEAFPGELRPWRKGPSGIPWTDPEGSLAALRGQAQAFAEAVHAGRGPWAVIWCAGSGIVGTPQAVLDQETRCFEALLEALGRHLQGVPGKVLLASSAGGVYGVASEHPLTERSPCRPISAYGENKLNQERALRAWAQAHPSASTLIARISNLYGPGQNLEKPQGLITHLARSHLHRTPITIFVPLDTLRDYLYVEDCAELLLRGLLRLGQAGREDVLKLFHSGETTTIAGLLGAFTRLTRGPMRIICSTAASTRLQPLHLPFRSTIWEDLVPSHPTSLAVGIQRVHTHVAERFQAGRLPPTSRA